MSEDQVLKRWASLMNARGIAGLGARETAEEKQIVERGILQDFIATIEQAAKVRVSDVADAEPPEPDFKANVNGHRLHIELTELIDPELVREAKRIRRTPDHPLNGEALAFDTSFDWFSTILGSAIRKKDERYAGRDVKIDVLLVWNEAEQLGIEDTDTWLKAFQLPVLQNIHSVYLQSWYHPHYAARPTWSLRAHRLIGEMVPILRSERD